MPLITYDKLKPEQQATYNESLQLGYYIGLSICTVAMVAAMIVRSYAQWLIRKQYTLDSWLTLTAFVITLGLNVINYIIIYYGGGLHVWRVIADDPQQPHNLVVWMRTGYFASVFNLVSYAFIKLAMLAFLHRIFGNGRPWFKWSVYVLAGFSAILGLATMIEFIVQCLPIPFFWNRMLALYAAMTKTPPPPESLDGWCMPQHLHTAVPMIAGMVCDVLIIFLPTLALWGVKLSKTKKLGIGFALSLGFFALGLDIVRLIQLYAIDHTNDVTWVNTPAALWSSIEYSAAFVCICIPAMAPLLRENLRNRTTKQYAYATDRSTPQALHSMRSPTANGYTNHATASRHRSAFMDEWRRYHADEAELSDGSSGLALDPMSVAYGIKGDEEDHYRRDSGHRAGVTVTTELRVTHERGDKELR